MDPRSRRQQHRDHDCQAGGEGGLSQKCNFGGNPRVFVTCRPVSDDRHSRNAKSGYRKKQLTPNNQGDPAHQRSESKGPNASHIARWADTFAPFTLGANQQADPERDGQPHSDVLS
jgi:hypothetical protein